MKWKIVSHEITVALNHAAPFELELPEHSLILDVLGVATGKLIFITLERANTPTHTRKFQVLHPGILLDSSATLTHVKTLPLFGGSSIISIFEDVG